MKKRRIVFRGSFNGDEVRLEPGSSVIEAGKFPTDETDEKFRASRLRRENRAQTSSGRRPRLGVWELRYQLRQRCEARMSAYAHSYEQTMEVIAGF